MTNAASMTYDSLVTDISSYMERTDTEFVNQIPRFILLAEQNIAAKIKTLWETTVLNTRVTQGQYYISKPARWKKTLSMKVAPAAGESTPPGTPMLIRDQALVSLINRESPRGEPQYYSDWDYDNWLLAPTPDVSYDIEIVYQGRIQPLDSNNQVNLITRECPQLLLYACLVEASVYLKSFEKLQVWQPLHDQALQALKSEDNERFIDKNSKRDQG